MNTAEHKHKTHPEYYKRSWPLTIICLLLALLIIIGVFMAWRHLAHDAFLIFSVILPSAVVAIVLIAAGLNGRKQAVNGIWGSLAELLFYWWM